MYDGIAPPEVAAEAEVAGPALSRGTPYVSHADRSRENTTLFVLCVAVAAYSIQQWAVFPALPTMQRDFGSSTAWTAWVVTGYIFVATVTTPLAGRLGDQYGKKRLLLWALALFAVGAVAATFAPNLGTLIAARILQGAGASTIPLTYAILKDEMSGEHLGRAVTILSTVGTVSGGASLILCGLIVDSLSWRGLFAFGAAGAGATILLVRAFVPASPPGAPKSIDFRGVILLSAGIISLLLALTEGNDWGWSSWQVLALFVASATALVSFTLVELHVPEPMVDVRMLAMRAVFFTNAASLVGGVAMIGWLVLVPLYLQTPRGLPEDIARQIDYGFNATTTAAGLYFLPGVLAAVSAGALATFLGRRLGWKYAMAAGIALSSIAVGSFAVWHDAPWQVIAGVVGITVGHTVTISAMMKLIVDAVRPSETGVATGISIVMRQIGALIGGQLVAAILTADTVGRTTVPAESAFVTAAALIAGISVVAVAFALLVTPLRRPSPQPVAEVFE